MTYLIEFTAAFVFMSYFPSSKSTSNSPSKRKAVRKKDDDITQQDKKDPCSDDMNRLQLNDNAIPSTETSYEIHEDNRRHIPPENSNKIYTVALLHDEPKSKLSVQDNQLPVGRMVAGLPRIARPTTLIPPIATFDSPGSGISSSISVDVESTRNAARRKHLLNDKWRELFDKFDPEGFGEIPWPDFVEALKTPEFAAEVEPNKIDILADKAERCNTTAITFQDFVNIMSEKRRRSFECAVHHRDREVCSENDFHVITKNPTLFERMVNLVAAEILPEDHDRKYYADHYTCCPPPLFIILITFIELGVFTYYTIATGEMNSSGPVPINSIFIYRPDKKLQVWRFILYMVLHAGWLHLLFNLLVQLLVGLPLEMVHGSVRIGIVYMAGVLAGSLGTSVFDADAYLVGASGGVYALLAAHLANVLLNFHQMQFGAVRLVGIFFIASVNVGFAVYNRYAPYTSETSEPVSYAAHLLGALAGLTIGLAVLKNFERKLQQQLIWWISLILYLALALAAVIYNILNPVPIYQRQWLPEM